MKAIFFLICQFLQAMANAQNKATIQMDITTAVADSGSESVTTAAPTATSTDDRKKKFTSKFIKRIVELAQTIGCEKLLEVQS